MDAAAVAQTLPGLATLEQTPMILEKVLVSTTEEQMRWKPAADRWSIGEVLGHLAEVEVLGFRARVQAMLEQEDPFLQAYDQNAAYAAGRYTAGRPRENLKQFCHERDRTVSWLRYIPAAQSSRTGRHGELGKITVGQLMNEWAFHDLGHIRQIAELYRSHAFWPSIGPFQRYYTIHP